LRQPEEGDAGAAGVLPGHNNVVRLRAKASAQKARESWLNRGVAGIGGASLLDDAGQEVPTALLPAFLTATLGAPAAALGVIEGVAEGVAGAARLAGGVLADDPQRRRRTAVGGYAGAAALQRADRCDDRCLASRRPQERRLADARAAHSGAERAAR
jgi:hypothetical protein